MLLLVFIILCAMIIHCDLLFRLIPDKIILCGLLCAFAGNIGSKLGFKGSVEGMIIGGLSIFIAGNLCFFISKKPALGGGDLKLLAMIGAFWGPGIALATFALAPILGSFWAAILKQTKLAYGLFLISSSFIALFFGRLYGY